MKKLLYAAPALLAPLAFARSAYAACISFDSTQIPFYNLGKIISNVLLLLFFVAGLLAFVFIVIGGIQWITAGGDKAAAQAARDRITSAVVGLLIVVAAFAITLILASVLGINIFSFVFPGATRTAGVGTAPCTT
ncbi:MAG: hypothetical protein Q8P13_00495 [bacterium]|nr:hypothetical protein [bacterium]